MTLTLYEGFLLTFCFCFYVSTLNIQKTPVYHPLTLFVNPSSLLPCSVELMPSKWGLVMDRLLVLSRRFSDTLTKVQVFLWRLLELHILKMVAFFSVWVALQEVKTERMGVVCVCL